MKRWTPSHPNRESKPQKKDLLEVFQEELVLCEGLHMRICVCQCECAEESRFAEETVETLCAVLALTQLCLFTGFPFHSCLHRNMRCFLIPTILIIFYTQQVSFLERFPCHDKGWDFCFCSLSDIFSRKWLAQNMGLWELYGSIFRLEFPWLKPFLEWGLKDFCGKSPEQIILSYK